MKTIKRSPYARAVNLARVIALGSGLALGGGCLDETADPPDGDAAAEVATGADVPADPGPVDIATEAETGTALPDVPPEPEVWAVDGPLIPPDVAA